jgi:hypothetical protein
MPRTAAKNKTDLKEFAVVRNVFSIVVLPLYVFIGGTWLIIDKSCLSDASRSIGL